MPQQGVSNGDVLWFVENHFDYHSTYDQIVAVSDQIRAQMCVVNEQLALLDSQIKEVEPEWFRDPIKYAQLVVQQRALYRQQAVHGDALIMNEEKVERAARIVKQWDEAGVLAGFRGPAIYVGNKNEFVQGSSGARLLETLYLAEGPLTSGQACEETKRRYPHLDLKLGPAQFSLMLQYGTAQFVDEARTLYVITDLGRRFFRDINPVLILQQNSGNRIRFGVADYTYWMDKLDFMAGRWNEPGLVHISRQKNPARSERYAGKVSTMDEGALDVHIARYMALFKKKPKITGNKRSWFEGKTRKMISSQLYYVFEATNPFFVRVFPEGMGLDQIRAEVG